VLLLVKNMGLGLPVSARGFGFVMIVGGGVAAFADLLTLSAYAHGLKVTSSFVIGGTSAVLVLIVGFSVLREPITWTRLLAVALIVGGIFLLQREGL